MRQLCACAPTLRVFIKRKCIPVINSVGSNSIITSGTTNTQAVPEPSRALDLERGATPGLWMKCIGHTEELHQHFQLENIETCERTDARASVLTTASTEVSTLKYGSKQNLILDVPPHATSL
jgi:hypothetical protein